MTEREDLSLVRRQKERRKTTSFFGGYFSLLDTLLLHRLTFDHREKKITTLNWIIFFPPILFLSLEVPKAPSVLTMPRLHNSLTMFVQYGRSLIDEL